jgi:hypothetical protein
VRKVQALLFTAALVGGGKTEVAAQDLGDT